MHLRRLRALCLLFAVALVASGCSLFRGTARQRANASIVTGISFDGQGPVSGLALRTAMEQGTSPFGTRIAVLNRLVDGVPLDLRALGRDAFRLETFYAHRGWFDARFEGWIVKRIKRDRTRRAGVVKVVGALERGEPTFFGVRGPDGGVLDRHPLQIDWGDTPKPLTRGLTNVMQRTGYLQPKAQFNLETVDYTRDQLLDILRNSAFAYAAIDVQMQAWPDEHLAEVVYAVNAGPVSFIGPITVTGHERAPEDAIRDAFGKLETGAKFKQSYLQDAQRGVFAMGAFSVVQVRADLSDPTQNRVPIHVTITEAPRRNMSFGGGFEFDGTVLKPRLSASFTHLNMFRRLVRAELSGNIGLAVIPAHAQTGEPLIDGVLGGIRGNLLWPRSIGRKVDLQAGGSLAKQLFEGQLAYTRATGDLDVVWRIGSQTRLSFGPGITWTTVPNESDASLLRVAFGDSNFSGVLIPAVDLGFTGDTRDPDTILSPRKGQLVQVELRQTLPYTLNELRNQVYTEVKGDLRYYRRLNFGATIRWMLRNPRLNVFGFERTPRQIPLSYALRLAGKWVVPWRRDGALSEVPYFDRGFLGGGTALRGWRQDAVGPYDCVCNQDRRTFVPAGGLISAVGSAELRYDFGSATLVTFGEVGALQPVAPDGSRDALRIRWDAGVGARYQTLVGPIRIDLAFRPQDSDETGFDAIEWVGCQDGTDQRRLRAWDLRSAFAAKRRAPDTFRAFRGPAVQLVIGLGDAL